MPEFPYTTVPGKIAPLFTKIRQVGVPSNVTIQWLRSVGFMSSNDRTLISVLEYIGFIDSSGAPTSKWTQYRRGNYKKVLGSSIRDGYADLFAVYPDANHRSLEELGHVFSTSSSGGQQVISKAISTFKTLAEQAEFDEHIDAQPPSDQSPVLPLTRESHPAPSERPTVHIDIQVHIAPEASGDQIDKIFSSMAKHLYGSQKSD